MGRIALAATVLALAMPVPVQAGTVQRAEKVYRLNVMLMVTALRCRHTRDDFQRDYAAFQREHLAELNAASAALRQSAGGGVRGFDRMSTRLANQYGQGHPWLECADLKIVARSLALMRGTAAIEEAADQLLASDGNAGQLAWTRR